MTRIDHKKLVLKICWSVRGKHIKMDQYQPPRLYNKDGDLKKRWYVGYKFRHPETNKFELHQVWISSKLHTNKARREEANRLIDIWNQKLRAGFNPYENENIGLVSLQEALVRIREIKKATTRKRTSATYKSFAKAFLAWAQREKLANIPIENFSARLAQKFADYLKIERKVSNRTHNNYIDGLKALFNTLVRREYFISNPFSKIEHLTEQERTIYAYNPAEIKLLKEYMPNADPKMWLVCQFIFYCAARPAEIVRIQIKHLNLGQGTLLIPGYSSKNRKNFIVDIVEPFLGNLRNLDLSRFPVDYYLFSKNLIPGPKEIAPVRLSERFLEHKNKLNLGRRLYDLKHTAAGMLSDNKAAPRDIQKHFRHHDLATTENYLKAFRSQPSESFLNHYPQI